MRRPRRSPRAPSARHVQLPVRDAEHPEVPRAVSADRGVAVDPDARARATVLDVPDPAVAAPAPPTPVSRILHARVFVGDPILADLPSPLPDVGIDPPLVGA